MLLHDRRLERSSGDSVYRVLCRKKQFDQYCPSYLGPAFDFHAGQVTKLKFWDFLLCGQ